MYDIVINLEIPRLGDPWLSMMYRTWAKKPDTEKEKILVRAAIYEKSLESL